MINLIRLQEKNLLGLATFFIALSFLIFEISLIRILSVLLLPSISFLAVSIALFGIAFGGMLIYLFPNYFSFEKLSARLKQYTLAYSLSLILFIIVIINLEMSYQDINLVNSLLLFGTSILPFILANVVLTSLFKHKNSFINRLYFFDLLGAGLGVILSVILLTFISPLSIILSAASISLLAAFIFNLKNKKLLTIIFLLIIVFLSIIPVNENFNLLKIKSLYNKFQGKEKEIIFSKWNSFSHIVVDSGRQEILQSFPQKLNVNALNSLGIRIDAAALTTIYNFDGDFLKLDFLNQDLSILGFKVVPHGKALVIGPGGGRDVLMGLMNGHQMTGVEINPIIVNDVMKGFAKDFSGNLYYHPDVNIVVAEGRSFINKSTEKYDVISIPLVDTWASSISGNLALVESNLYTVEAFEDYLSHLSDKGMLTISRWEFDGMRLISLFLEASKNLNLKNPENNLAIVRTNGLDNYLFKTTPLTQEEKNTIEKFSSGSGFSLMYLPGKNIDNDFNAYLNSQDKKKFVKNFSKNISPVYDNQPFFFFTPKVNLLTDTDYYFIDGGLFTTLFITLGLTIFLILLPTLIKLRSLIDKNNAKLIFKYIGYFAAIGLAFILIEIALIQKFILYLEHPIYSYSVVLATMLIAAGLGSFISSHLAQTKKVILIRGIALTICIVVINLAASIIIEKTIGLEIFIKIIISITIVTPASILMGTMMPLGIKRLADDNFSQAIPWAWSVNGATSVLGSVLAITVAIFYGFNFVITAGALIYLLATILIYSTKK